MREVDVEVIGVEPPCPRCFDAMNRVKAAATRLESSDIRVNVQKLNIMSREVLKRYGVIMSPALTINKVVKIMGRVPSEAEVEKLIREAAEKTG